MTLAPLRYFQYLLTMPAAIPNIEKRGRGRPATNATPVMVRLPPDDLELLDAWITANGEMSRPEALRRILKLVAMRTPG